MDGVESLAVRRTQKATAPYLLQVMQACLALGYFPRAWKQACICLFLKPGRPSNDPASYRLISLGQYWAKRWRK